MLLKQNMVLKEWIVAAVTDKNIAENVKIFNNQEFNNSLKILIIKI